MADQIAVRITADISGLTDGLKNASEAVKKSAQDMGGGFSQTGDVARAAGKHVDGFTNLLREFKTEQTNNSRAARFFGNEIASIIPGAEGAQTAIRGLFSILMEGSLLGAGIEIAKVTLEAFVHSMHEAEERAKTLRNVYRDTGKEVADSMRSIERAIDGSVSRTQEARRAISDKTRDIAHDANKEVQELLRKAGGLRDIFAWLTQQRGPTGMSVLPDFLKVKSQADLIAEKQAPVLERVKKIDEEQTKIKKTWADERVKIEEAADREMESLYAASRDEILQIETELDNKLEELDLHKELTAAKRAEKAVELEADAARRILLVRTQREVEANARLLALESQFHDHIWQEEQALLGRVEKLRSEMLRADTAERKAELQKQIDDEISAANRKIELLKRTEKESIEARMRVIIAQRAGADEEEIVEAELRNRLAEIRRTINAGSTDEERRRAEERINLAKFEATEKFKALSAMKIGQSLVDPILSSWRTTLRELMDGTATWASFVKNMAVSIGDAIAEDLFKVIKKGLLSLISEGVAETAASKVRAISDTQGNIAVAVSGAAASQAFIPFAGPALAAGAASGMLGLLEGMTAPLLAARGGFDIPSGLNPIVQAHQREMILPEKHADVIRDIADHAGGSGGNHFHFHGLVVGTRGFFEMPETRLAMREARRNGRLG